MIPAHWSRLCPLALAAMGIISAACAGPSLGPLGDRVPLQPGHGYPGTWAGESGPVELTLVLSRGESCHGSVTCMGPGRFTYINRATSETRSGETQYAYANGIFSPDSIVVPMQVRTLRALVVGDTAMVGTLDGASLVLRRR